MLSYTFSKKPRALSTVAFCHTLYDPFAFIIELTGKMYPRRKIHLTIKKETATTFVDSKGSVLDSNYILNILLVCFNYIFSILYLPLVITDC